MRREKGRGGRFVQGVLSLGKVFLNVFSQLKRAGVVPWVVPVCRLVVVPHLVLAGLRGQRRLRKWGRGGRRGLGEGRTARSGWGRRPLPSAVGTEGRGGEKGRMDRRRREEGGGRRGGGEGEEGGRRR